jgi:zinc transporter ZupT
MGRLVLLIAQLVVVGVGGLAAIKYIDFDVLKVFIYGMLFALLAWLTGFVGARVLQGVNPPSQQALFTSIAGGLIGAALLFVPQMRTLAPQLPELAWPIVGAVLGYHVRR